VDITSPDSPSELERSSRSAGCRSSGYTARAAPSFTAPTSRRWTDPVREGAASRPATSPDLKSMYLDKYADAAVPKVDGWLRHNLHQLRYGPATSESKKGTVSAAGSARGGIFRPTGSGGYNPQQVVAVEKQLERGWNPDYVVRRLIVPGPGEVCLYAADMMQVEYRLFAHYANDPNILEVYRNNPLADYHKVVMELLHRVAPHLNRKLVKNVNFAKIYGAGLVKFALMIGSITEQQFIEFSERLQMKDWSVMGHPALAEAKKLNDDYNRMFPR
jgi:hypothetical protein